MALLEACRLAHDDDAPRLVWADAVGGERGELVVLQCDLARGGLSPDGRAARQRRVDELLAAHGAAWAGDLARLATRWEFRRGFIEAAELTCHTFVYRTDAIVRAAPLLVSLTLTGDDDADLHHVFTRPAFWQLNALDVVDPAISDAAAVELQTSAALGSLRALGLAGLTPRAAHELVASGELADLEVLRLRRATLGDDALLAIIRAARSLVRLDIPDLADEVRARLPPTVRIATGPFGLL